MFSVPVLFTSLSCIGFTKPVHCLFVIVAVAFNVLLRAVRNARNLATLPSDNGESTAVDVPLRPTCSYAVLIALHVVSACYLANQLSMLRRQLPIAKSVCLLNFAASFLIFFSALGALLHITDDDDLVTVFAESVCFLILVLDFSKPLRVVRLALKGDRNDFSMQFIDVLTENFVDLLMQLLIISLGVLFHLPAVIRACIYAALGLSSSFLSFYLIVPSVLSIAMSLDAKFDDSVFPRFNYTKADGSNGGIFEKPSSMKKVKNLPASGDVNHLARRVKFIMSTAILLVHAHSRLLPSSSPLATSAQQVPYQRIENISFERKPHNIITETKRIDSWASFDEISAADWGLTLVLAVVVCLRFLLFTESPAREVTIDHSGIETPQSSGTSTPVSSKASTSTPPCRPKLFTTDSIDEDSSCYSQRSTASNNAPSPPEPISVAPVSVITTPVASKKIPSVNRKRLDDAIFLNSDEEVVNHLFTNDVPLYSLEEKLMNDPSGKEAGAVRAVAIRRGVLSKRHPTIASGIDGVPYAHYGEFSNVVGACCENVIGTIPLPVGLAGPLVIDETEYLIPMATTEGCLVASVNRGCKVLTTAGGVRTVLTNEGMTRAPVVRLPDITAAAELSSWLKDPANFGKIATVFNGTSRFLRLSAIEPLQAGAFLYIRFVAKTGDAMGMNMVSRASESAISYIISEFPACRLLSLSGNVCSDKKSAAVNWVLGRGKSVISEAIIPRKIVCETLRTTPEALVRLNTSKNFIGSAVAGAVAGGFNAHAANIIAAMFLATGQDAAQVVESSACLTILEVTGDTPATSVSDEPHSGDLHITCTLPSIEVGTIGGGTILGPQKSCLEILGVAGSALEAEDVSPGDNARRLARVIAAAVLAGELSLLAALATNQLMPAHLRLNRSQLSINSSCSPASSLSGKANNNDNNSSKNSSC